MYYHLLNHAPSPKNHRRSPVIALVCIYKRSRAAHCSLMLLCAIQCSFKRGTNIQLSCHVLPDNVGSQHSWISSQGSQQLLLYGRRAVKSHHKMVSLKVSLLIFRNDFGQCLWPYASDSSDYASVIQYQFS